MALEVRLKKAYKERYIWFFELYSIAMLMCPNKKRSFDIVKFCRFWWLAMFCMKNRIESSYAIYEIKLILIIKNCPSMKQTYKRRMSQCNKFLLIDDVDVDDVSWKRYMIRNVETSSININLQRSQINQIYILYWMETVKCKRHEIHGSLSVYMDNK